MILKCIIDLKVEHKKAILYTNYMLLSHRLIFLKHLFLVLCDIHLRHYPGTILLLNKYINFKLNTQQNKKKKKNKNI